MDTEMDMEYTPLNQIDMEIDKESTPLNDHYPLEHNSAGYGIEPPQPPLPLKC